MKGGRGLFLEKISPYHLRSNIDLDFLLGHNLVRLDLKVDVDLGAGFDLRLNFDLTVDFNLRAGVT